MFSFISPVIVITTSEQNDWILWSQQILEAGDRNLMYHSDASIALSS